MTEYIERDKVLAKAAPVEGCFSDMISAYDVASIPAADVVEVRHGRWQKMDTTGIDARESVWNCSACGFPVGIWSVGSKYCPNCGARMDGVK